MGYLSKLDSHAEQAVKVIDYFDALVQHGATLEACVRATAGLCQCSAGLRDTSASWVISYNQRGTRFVERPSSPSISHPVLVDDHEVGEVWLERDEPVRPLDDFVIERFALAVASVWRVAVRPTRSVASIFEGAVAPGMSARDRERALVLLGISPQRRFHVAAVASDDYRRLAEGLSVARDWVLHPGQPLGSSGTGWAVCSAVLGDVGVVIAQPPSKSAATRPWQCSSPGPFIGIRVGATYDQTADRIGEAWQEAQAAAQFGGLLGLGPVVDYNQLGVFEALLHLPTSVVAANRDVKAIDKLAHVPHGRELLEAVNARLSCRSLRQAASSLYLHHSSVAYRLRQAEKLLDFDLENPVSRLRAELAIVLWRLSSR